MLLKFHGMYILSVSSDNYLKDTKVVALRPRYSEKEKQYEFLVPSDDMRGHSITVKSEKEDSDSILVTDATRTGTDDKTVIWRFEPLTLKRWNKLGEEGRISGWTKYEEHFGTDTELKHFYDTEFLADTDEWWHPDADEQ